MLGKWGRKEEDPGMTSKLGMGSMAHGITKYWE